MTVFRCAEGQSRTGIHDTLEFLHLMVGNSIEETVAIVYKPTGYKCMNQFLSTFTSKVFPYVSDIIQIKECTTTGLCYMRCHIHVQVEPGAQISCRVYGNYMNIANPNTVNRHFRKLLARAHHQKFSLIIVQHQLIINHP